MSKRDNFLLILDMVESARRIELYTKLLDYDLFINDQKTLDAVVRNFEIIGEAAARLDSEFQNEHSELPWRQLRGYRNRLIHEYFGVDYQIIWEIIQEDLPKLIRALEKINGSGSQSSI